jgi:hypothetical protein
MKTPRGKIKLYNEGHNFQIIFEIYPLETTFFRKLLQKKSLKIRVLEQANFERAPLHLCSGIMTVAPALCYAPLCAPSKFCLLKKILYFFQKNFFSF